MGDADGSGHSPFNVSTLTKIALYSCARSVDGISSSVDDARDVTVAK
jgi:hypothetical protein